MIYIIQLSIGFVCYDVGIPFNYFNTKCDTGYKESSIVSKINCKNPDYFYVLPKEKLKEFNKQIKCEVQK